MTMQRIGTRELLAFGLAFVIGVAVFQWGGQVLTAEADLHLQIVGVDTDLGVTTIAEKGGLAEASWWPNPARIQVDPDRAGSETFTVTTTGVVFIGLVPVGISQEETISVSRATCGKPDIVVAITNARTAKHPIISGTPKDFTTPSGEAFKLYKTVFWVILMTDADTEADTIFAEVAHKANKDLGIAQVEVEPPVGDVWEGNAYIEYEITNHPGAFIYEAYVDADPTVGRIAAGEIDQSLDLEAGAIHARARAGYVSQGAIPFYDALGGGEVLDSEARRTPRAILPLGGKLGVGADPIIEERTLLPDEFKGWNLFEVAIKYQVAVWVAVPADQTVDAGGDPLPEEEVLTGSQHEEAMGDPQYYEPRIKDIESWANKLLPQLGQLGDKLWLVILGVVTVLVILVLFRVFLWLFPRRPGR